VGVLSGVLLVRTGPGLLAEVLMRLDMPSQPPWSSCIMPTFSRWEFVPKAIRYFLGQNCPQQEMIVANDGAHHISNLISKDERIPYVHSDQRGAKRNVAREQAGGSTIAHWHDDWHALCLGLKGFASQTNEPE